MKRVSVVSSLESGDAEPVRVMLQIIGQQRRIGHAETLFGTDTDFDPLESRASVISLKGSSPRYGANEGVAQVREPTLARCLEGSPAVIGAQPYAEEVAEFAVEVGELRWRGVRGGRERSGSGVRRSAMRRRVVAGT